MSHWDSKLGVIVRWPSQSLDNGWELIDCGCCNGLEWGGDYPVECNRCSGGMIARHIASGRLALYPGGPFRGRMDAEKAKEST